MAPAPEGRRQRVERRCENRTTPLPFRGRNSEEIDGTCTLGSTGSAAEYRRSTRGYRPPPLRGRGSGERRVVVTSHGFRGGVPTLHPWLHADAPSGLREARVIVRPRGSRGA